jgi:hypothetical protein
MKIHPVGAELFHAERQTDVTKLAVAFRNFATTPKICILTSAAICTDIFVKRVKVMKVTVNSLNIH